MTRRGILQRGVQTILKMSSHRRYLTDILKISPNMDQVFVLKVPSKNSVISSTTLTGCDSIGWLETREHVSANEVLKEITCDSNQYRIRMYSSLIDNFIENEKKFCNTHFSLYHGLDGLITTSVLFRTILARYLCCKEFNNYFLLRDIASCEHIKEVDDATEWALTEWENFIEHSPSLFHGFDHLSQIKEVLLSVTISALGNVNYADQENSWEFIYSDEVAKEYDKPSPVSFLSYPLNFWTMILTLPFSFAHNFYLKKMAVKNQVNQDLIKKTFVSYNLSLDLYEKYKDEFAEISNIFKGSVLQIFIPKELEKPCMYTSGPMGRPLKTYQNNEHWNDFENMEKLTKKLKELRLNRKFFLDERYQSYSRTFIKEISVLPVQARLFLNPTYFEDPNSGIHMQMYCAANQKMVSKALTRLHEIAKSIACCL